MGHKIILKPLSPKEVDKDLIQDALILKKASFTLSNKVLIIRQSMEFSIPKHLHLSSIVISFSLDVTKCRGILIGDKNSKSRNQSSS